MYTRHDSNLYVDVTAFLELPYADRQAAFRLFWEKAEQNLWIAKWVIFFDFDTWVERSRFNVTPEGVEAFVEFLDSRE